VQVLGQVLQLVVVATLVVRHNRNAVLRLEIVRIDRIVYKHNSRKVSPEHTQVLYIEPFRRVITLVPVEPVFEKLLLCLQHVDYFASVTTVPGSEDHQLVLLL
jgi:hypothetical protein